MNHKPMTVGVIGTGMICRIYIENIAQRFEIVELKAVADISVEKAREVADQFGVRACTVDELIADPEIDIILNLTPPSVHYDIMKRALLAGKHVYTEKTFTMNTREAAELVALAEEKGLMIGSAPDTFFAGWVQNARAIIDSGRLGRITSFAMVGNRDNDRMLGAMPYMNKPGGGVLLDYCVYYLTVLINLLGPVRDVSAKILTPYRQHVNHFPDSPTYGLFLHALFLGGYSEALTKYMEEKGFTPRTEEGDFETISQKVDFYGLNFYNGIIDNAEKIREMEKKQAAGGNYQSRPEQHPEAIYDVLHMLDEKYHVEVPIYVTENGYIHIDEGDKPVEYFLDDPDRIEYLRDVLQWVRRAMDNDPETIESCLDVLDLKPGETAVITGEDQTAADFTPLPGNDTEDHFFGVKRVRRF